MDGKTSTEIGKQLEKFVEILKRERLAVSSVVLFGSRSKNLQLKESDIDLLIILKETELSFHERFYKIHSLWNNIIQLDALVFTEKEVLKLFNRGHIALFDALENGLIIYDTGFFREMKEKFAIAKRDKRIYRSRRGWWSIREI